MQLLVASIFLGIPLKLHGRSIDAWGTIRKQVAHKLRSINDLREAREREEERSWRELWWSEHGGRSEIRRDHDGDLPAEGLASKPERQT